MTRTALFVRWVLGLSAVIFLGLGLLFIFTPTMMIEALDITAEPGKALADIRAVYGGLDLTIGILLIYFFVRKQWATGLGIAALTCTCLAAGRVVGILLDPANDILTFGLFAVEVLGAVLAAVGLFLSRQPEVPVTVVQTVAATPAAPVVAPAATTTAESPAPTTEV